MNEFFRFDLYRVVLLLRVVVISIR